MSDIALSSLRVGAEFDASKYTAGGAQKVGTDKAMVASANELTQALSQTETKISSSGNVVSILARRYVEGQKETQAFERDLRSLSRQLETGKVSIEGASAILVGMNQRLGLTADVSELAAKGQTQLAAAVAAANVQIEGQATALTQTAAAHAMMIAQARAEQAAENSRQVGAANQNSFNRVLGVSSPPAAGARASASIFEAEFTRLDGIAQQKAAQIGQTFGADLDQSLVAGTAKSARDAAATFSAELDRLDEIAALKARQIGTAFQSDLNSSFGIGSSAGNSSRASASVFEEAGREADQMTAKVTALRAELNPLAAAQDKLNAELAEYSALAAKGAISAEELAQAQALVNSRYGAQNGVITAGTNALRLNRIGMMELQASGINAFQALASGMSAFRVAEMEGAQVIGALVQGTEGGLSGLVGVVKGLGAGLVGFIASPLGMVLTATTAAIGGIAAYGMSGRDHIREVDAVLKDHEKNIRALKDAYGEAADAAIAYGKLKADEGRAGIAIPTAITELELRLSLANEARISSKSLIANDNGLQGGSQMGPTINSNFKDFAGEIDAYRSSIAKGAPDVLALRKAITEKWDLDRNNEELTKEAAAIFKLTDAAAKLQLALPGAKAALDALNNGRYPSFADIQPRQDYQDQNSADLTWAQRQQSAALGRIGAKSPEELRQAAMAAEAAKPSPANESNDVSQYKIASAGALAYAQALHQLKEAQDQRTRALDQTLASAKLDVDLIGKTTAATEGLRMAFQLEQQVREEAARNNTKVDEAEIARIKQKAEEYGKLKALQEARDTIHNQQIDLETQKAEVATVGENTLARQAAAAALKTEQDIRKLGIPLYGQEANAMRANTAALSDQAAALAKASLQADLLFERSQILRNADDQEIASRLQSAGLPVDLNSAEANMMRYNMALQETKDTFKGFATDMLSSLEQGKSLWESFGNAAKNALAKIADKLIDRGLDGIFNSLFGGQGSSGAGVLGDLLNFGNGGSSSQQQSQGSSGGSFLGKLFGAGGQSVGSMQVQATSVFINGSPVGGAGGGISDILSKLGSPSFKADTTLSDILGYGGAANQNTIQSRIDQAFGTGGSAQDMIQSRIDQAFGTSGGLGGIFSPSGGFASVLGGGGLTGSMSSYASAIKAIESAGSGGYSALGPVLKNGDQALGAYQVMNSNLPSWSTQAFGSPMSKSDFMSNPGAQDAIFQQQFGKLLNKYGNSNDAASAWFTGGPLSSGAGKADILGTTGSKYVDKFNAALEKVTGTAQQATGSISSLGGASQDLISQFSKMGQSLLSQLTPATSGSSWFQGLSSMFGGSAGALGYMNSISPAATSDILSGSWGLFDSGGYTGSGGRKEAAGIVHRGEVVWSQEDVARAGGVHVVEGMRRGYAGYADGGVVRPRMRFDGNSSPRQSSAPPAANDRPAQNINQTIVYQLNERPISPASQNQNAARNAHALERLTRTQ